MTSFKDWLDARNISPEEAATIFGKSVGTIRNWRSSGVPDLLRSWVEQRMAALDAPAGKALDRVVLEITDEQFAAWNDAANAAGLRLKEWAIASLDEEAATDPTLSGTAPDPVALVRELDTPYCAPKKNEGAA